MAQILELMVCQDGLIQIICIAPKNQLISHLQKLNMRYLEPLF